MKYVCSTVMLITMLAACNPAASTQTIFPSATSALPTEKIYPTDTPPPTITLTPILPPGQGLSFDNIYMMDEQNGWGITNWTNRIVHTNDGGQTWEDVTPPTSYQDFVGTYPGFKFFALDANTAWTTPSQHGCYVKETCPSPPDNAIVWHTSDGGNTWQRQRVCLQKEQECDFNFAVSAMSYEPIEIYFLNEQTGWLLVTVGLSRLAPYRLYHTTDGGAHWQPIMDTGSQDAPAVVSVTGLVFQDKQTGWMSTFDLHSASPDWGIYQSTDGGLTWKYTALPEPNPLPPALAKPIVECGAEEIVLLPPNMLGVTIRCEAYKGVTSQTTIDLSVHYFYFHSMDGGEHWTSWPMVGGVDFINTLVGWRFVSDYGVPHLEQTRDGGQKWTRIKGVNLNGDLDFVNEQTGWAIILDYGPVLLRTTDGGQTWEEIQPVVATP